MSHPRGQTRDTSSYGPLRELAGTKRPSLKNLAKKAVGIDIQEGEHSSVGVMRNSWLGVQAESVY